jgi:hypothetical protein
MARKSVTVIVDADNRDHKKRFTVTEFPADRAERWALRALAVLAASGASLPSGAENAGMAGLAAVGVSVLPNLSAQFPSAEPLLKEMFDSIRYQHDPKHPPQEIYTGDMCQVEEVSTLFMLRKAWLELHLDFLRAGAALTTGYRIEPARAPA